VQHKEDIDQVIMKLMNKMGCKTDTMSTAAKVQAAL